MEPICKEEEHKKEKASWPRGEWDREPDRVDFEHAGLPCLLHRGPGGHWCGYAGVMEGHPWYQIDYSQCPKGNCEETYCGHSPESVIEVHGGLTYSDKCQGHICHVPKEGQTDQVWWFGFDCAHCDDLSPAHRFSSLSGREEYKNLMYVTEETKKLAEQLSKVKA